MNNTGNGLVYLDQATAENIASQRRIAYAELLSELEALAESTNSLALSRLVETKRESFDTDMRW